MKLAVVALVLLPMPAALAQTSALTPTVPDAAPAAPAPDDTDLKRHHQPTRAEIAERLKEHGGDAALDKRSQREQAEVDQLYQQLMHEPMPKPGR